MKNEHELELPIENVNILILCGGFGSRIKNLTSKIPKPLLKINKKEFLFYIIENLSRYNMKNIYLLCFYKVNFFKKFVKKINKRLNLNIKIIIEKKKLDTGGSIINATNKIKFGDYFLTLNGDTYLNINYINNYKYFINSKKNNLLILTKSNLLSNKLNKLNLNKRKIILRKKSDLINSGNFFFKRQFLKNYLKKKNQVISLENSILKNSILKQKLYGKLVDAKIIDIGSYKFLKQSEKFLKNNHVPKTIFLDRDGTLNYDRNGYTYKISDLNLIQKNINYIRKNYHDYYKVIVTNQSGIGRGYFTKTKFKLFCKKLLEKLEKKEIYISKIIFCPHHINAKKKFRKNCDFRKPNISGFKYLQKSYNLKFNKSVFMGNSKEDFQVAKSLNIKYLNVNKFPFF